ncbi:PREDICTED: putative fidgetin-like protein 2, partial [Mesitornis unicolor]|uniref:putative fidgetin-like protein 2 n=1 Tax=Mesitornis unicolor TaxID=54374 RepID=UPI000528C7DA
TLKRKAFDVGEDEVEGRYRKYSYEQPKSPYPMSDNGECRGNGFGGSAGSPQVAFKTGKRPAGNDPGAYTGVGRPPRTILLFGPRGTGKTLLSRCISTQLGSTLLKLSGTTLLSTWKAEAEKILQTVFFVASCRQPAVVLITEAESLLVARAGEDGNHVNLKSQLPSSLDNVPTSSDQNVVVIGTTSRPGSMDEASHRRFAKRFYISPPDSMARRQILHHALAQQSSCLSEHEMASLVQHTESFSGGELVQLCQHAGATTLRGLPAQIQPTSYQDLEKAFCKVRPAASQKELDLFLEWDKMYGTQH